MKFTLAAIAAAIATATFTVSPPQNLLKTKGIVVSRTVEQLNKGTVKLEIDSGCTSTDDYGSNDCTFPWGSTVFGSVSAEFSENITSGNINANLKLDGIVGLKIDCPVCGGDCSFTVPIIKQDVSFTLPDCPLIVGVPVASKFNFTLPDSNPVLVSISVKGSGTVTDQSGDTIATVDITASVA